MKFLKALKKSGDETPKLDLPSEDKAPSNGRFQNVVPGLFEEQNLKIGREQTVSPAEGVNDSSASYHSGSSASVIDGGDRTPEPFPTIFVDQDNVNRHLVAITEPKSSFCEEYRNLRTTLLQKRKKQKLKTIAVVSVAPAEGKSITALNLAWLLAQTDGISALAIDGDLRLPSLAGYVGYDSKVGLSEVLDGDIELKNAIVRLEPSGLHMLPGGHQRDDVGELMSGPTFANILAEAQSQFDFVIIDAPPLSVFVDAKVLINQTDGTLLVLRSNYTNCKDLARVLEDLPRERMLGVVLNQAEETLISGRYYDYPYYRRD
jgi:capsular exopolysaccharide synthesis family protein